MPRPKKNKKYRTQVKIVLQGRVESFSDYELRLNDILKDLKIDDSHAIVLPCADQTGRMCCAINYKLFI